MTMPRSYRLTALLPTAAFLSVLPVLVAAQDRPAPAAPAASAPAPAPAASAAAERVSLIAGHSTILTTDFDVVRLAITNQSVADGVVVQPREVLVDGKGPGSVSLFLWGNGIRKQYDVVVEPAVTSLQQRLQNLFPGEDISVTTNDEAIVLSGHVSSTGVMLKAGDIAKASSDKSKVVNLLQLPGGQPSQQVMLQVRFAEVNRKAVDELGASLFTGALGYKNWAARSTTGQFAAPVPDTGSDQNTLTFSDFLNIFVFNTKYNMGGVLRALRQKGFLQSLAEPNLIAYNGKEASFLAGGEFPIPIVQGLSNGVSVQFKEFGVRLSFTPTIAGDVIHLKVKPEVSSLDFNNGITLSGFRIPSLITRRAETEVELRDGQSFAIAGLLNNLSQDTTTNIPFLSQIPIIGRLFKSRAEQAERTELMVLITPQLVRPLEPDEVPPLPTNPKPFIKNPGGEPGGVPLADGPAPGTDPKSKKKPSGDPDR
jgi:pilus assembly protein CpaC